MGHGIGKGRREWRQTAGGEKRIGLEEKKGKWAPCVVINFP